MRPQWRSTVNVLQLVADPTRRRILRLIWTDEQSAGDIAKRVPVTFGAVSQHLALMREAGIVTLRREGRKRYYKADVRALGPVAAVLHATWTTQLKRLKTLAEREEHQRGGPVAPEHRPNSRGLSASAARVKPKGRRRP